MRRRSISRVLNGGIVLQMKEEAARQVPLLRYFANRVSAFDSIFFIERFYTEDGVTYSGVLRGKYVPEPLDHTKEGRARYL